MKHITITSSQGSRVEFLARSQEQASGGLGTMPEASFRRFGLSSEKGGSHGY